MKILVLQLARFGDIYLTWPTLRALHRTHPEAELHLLVREKFRFAADGLQNVQVHVLPTAKVLSPVLPDENASPDFAGCESELSQWLHSIDLNWDKIINLSFSPFSSYLTDFLTKKNTVVRGYTRHSDGFFAIPDDASAYFYAQVGIGRYNRFHLADIFAMVAEVDLQTFDWGFEGELESVSLNKPYVVVHLGASQIEKRYPLKHFKKVLQSLAPNSIYLVGSNDEKNLTEPLLGLPHVHSLIGETSLRQLFSIVQGAEFVIGADSAPVHIAAHVKTRVLNLSFSTVNFWETGPISEGSWVVQAEKPEDLSPDDVIKAAQAMLAKHTPPNGVLVVSRESGPRFVGAADSFCWSLIQALYMHADYPVPHLSTTASGVKRLIEVAEMAVEQLGILKKNLRAPVALEILSAVDETLTKIADSAPELGPLIRWFETERLRIPPQDVALTFKRTNELFQDLVTIAHVLGQQLGANFEELQRQGLERLREIENQIPSCALSFRLYQTAKAEPILQRLLNYLTFFDSNGLHHVDSTKVGSGKQVIQDWNRSYGDYREILNQLILAFEKQDYVYVADLIEYELAECLSQWRTQIVKFDTSVLP